MLASSIPIALAALSTLAAAAPNPIVKFASIALRSGSPIHYQPITARDSAIWVGGETESSCPVGGCPPKFGKYAVIDINSETGYAFMDVAVPGGQQLYIAPDGAVSYTVPHSTFMPKGSVAGGFGTFYEGENLDILTWKFTGLGGLATDLFACPVETYGQTEYKVYANTKAFKKAGHEGCLLFTGLVEKYKGTGAYQYD